MNSVRLGSGGLLLAVICVFAASCAGNPKKAEEPELTPASSEPANPKPHEYQYGCVDDDGEPRTCTNTSECCKGYSCSIDPSRSRVLRYCLGGS